MIHDISRQRSRKQQQSAAYRVAFVLSGGAARGAIQVGMLQVLLERGINPDLIVGTSVGSFNGAWLACHPTIEGVRALEQVWLRVRAEHIFPGGPMSMLFHLLQHRPALYRNDGIRRFLNQTAIEGGFQGHTFADLRIPLAVVATNLTRGRPEVIDRGPVIPALLASAAIPAVLPPVMVNGDQYVDGGLLDNVGLRIAIERGAERTYVLDTSWDGEADKPAGTFEEVVERSLQVLTAYHLHSAVEYYAKRTQVVVLRADTSVASTGLNFHSTHELIAAGRAVAERVLDTPVGEANPAIQRRGATFWPALPLHAGTETQPDVRSLGQAIATSVRTLPERLQFFVRALGIGGSGDTRMGRSPLGEASEKAAG